MKAAPYLAVGFSLFTAASAPSAAAGGLPAGDPFVGIWVGTRADNGIKRVVITAAKGGYKCQIWAFATFDEIDWGKRPLHVYFADVGSKKPVAAMGEWQADFADELVIFRREGRALVMEDFTRFKDKSGRSDFKAVERLNRRSPVR